MMKFLLHVFAKIGILFTLSEWFRTRKYKSGTGWCFFRWTDVESEYILRLHVVKTPWFAVCLHWIRKADKEPWLHDHPVSFLSIILRGKYAELRERGNGDVGHEVHTWFNFVVGSKTDKHRIIFTRANTLTLCLMGPKTRDWGFHMPEGWVMWKDYYARLKAGENMRCETFAERIGEPIIPALEKYLTEHVTEDHVLTVVGAPRGAVVDEDLRAIDTGTPDDFDDEAPTEPRS